MGVFKLLLLLSALGGILGADDLIGDHLASASVTKQGEDATLRCQIKDVKAQVEYDNVVWNFKKLGSADAKMICNGTGQTGECEEDEGKYIIVEPKENLQIVNISADDAGTYECTAYEDDTPDGPKSGELAVIDGQISCDKPDKVEVDETAKFSCSMRVVCKEDDFDPEIECAINIGGENLTSSCPEPGTDAKKNSDLHTYQHHLCIKADKTGEVEIACHPIFKDGVEKIPPELNVEYSGKYEVNGGNRSVMDLHTTWSLLLLSLLLAYQH